MRGIAPWQPLQGTALCSSLSSPSWGWPGGGHCCLCFTEEKTEVQGYISLWPLLLKAVALQQGADSLEGTTFSRGNMDSCLL